MQNNERAVALLTAVLNKNSGSQEWCDLLLELWPALCELRSIVRHDYSVRLSMEQNWHEATTGVAHIALMDAIQRYFVVHGKGYQSIFAHNEKKDG